MEENYKPLPIEFMHGCLLNEFHKYRTSINEDKLYVKMSGKEFNDIVAIAKRETYRNYKIEKERDLQQLSELLDYSNKYEISVQFWPDQVAVYIAKDGVDLGDWGGDFDYAIPESLKYLNRINNKKT